MTGRGGEPSGARGLWQSPSPWDEELARRVAARWGWPSTWQIDKVCGSEYARYRWYRYGIRDESGNADVGVDMAESAERWERPQRRDQGARDRRHAVQEVMALLGDRAPTDLDMLDVVVVAHYVVTGDIVPYPLRDGGGHGLFRGDGPDR